MLLCKANISACRPTSYYEIRKKPQGQQQFLKSEKKMKREMESKTEIICKNECENSFDFDAQLSRSNSIKGV